MGFDNRKDISYVADAPSFSAVIAPGTAVQTAAITYKKGWKPGPPSVTTSTMDQLMAALLRLDNGCKFYKRGAAEGTLSAKNAATLDALKNDPHTPDAVYRTACRSFGVKPEPRNITTAPVASTANLPQGVPALRASAEAWMAFETAHGELFTGVFAQQNLNVIENWFADEKVQWTADSLAQCYVELKAAQCFRTATTLSRGLNGSLQIVQPYSHDRIVAMRRQQVVSAANAAPSNLSEVDASAWNAVRVQFPQVPVGSPAFRKLCSDQVLAWARQYCLEADPSLGAANKCGEMRVAIDRVIMQWTRNPNLGQGQKTIRDTRLWLG